MRYRDLVQFEPIETVIQLRDADQRAEAERLVRTYVISERMADQLANVVISELQFDSPRDNKGVLIVGNYGTGKSHLLSVLSALAEHADLVQVVENAPVRQAAGAIAGRFKVLRVEIGGVTKGLREILLDSLEAALEEWGAPYHFPPASQLNNNKDPLLQAVQGFRDRYPEQGILLVVDELLDYLRAREERQLILDLGFLRELGEVAPLAPLRFVAGLQETLFDSPRFSFVAEQLHRVRDRFTQVRIVREDVAYVVSHRLLRKTDEQLARVTEHLRRFTTLYPRLGERLGECAQLFPIHPAYLDAFERLYIAEKREVLRTLSDAMRALIDQEAPADQPGLIAYDHYWGVLCDNPSLRGLPGVAEVVRCSSVLEGRIQAAYTRKHLLPMALRIIHGLSVHRLTTTDINLPLGATAEELRDDLCLYAPIPEASAEFLLGQVQVALREIIRTVSGQFIAFNAENGQYYLDPSRTEDFDEEIRERGDSLGEDELNRFFCDALRQALGLSTTTYVTGFRIWPYELPWAERKVTRPGYLFFGAPDERSTAQPPRDFYVYFLPPFQKRDWSGEAQSDEVLFQLTGLGQECKEMLQLYAGARLLAGERPDHRAVFADKAEQHYRRFARWLQEQARERLQVTYQGVTEPIAAVLARSRSSASGNLEEMLRLIAAQLLAPEFAERYPDYPAFSRLSQPVSEAGRPTNAMEAIRCLAGRGRTNLAVAVLDGLELLDGEGAIRPYGSRYARRFLELLQAKAENQVLNRGELIEQVAGGLQPVEKDILFHLEPEWVAVVLLALVYSGDAVLSLDGREELDASTIERAALRSIKDLTDFRFLKRPRTVPVGLWTLIFDGLGLPSGLVRDENTRDEAVRRLAEAVRSELEQVALAEGQVQQGLQLWNAAVFTDNMAIVSQGGVVLGAERPGVSLLRADLLPHLRNYKRFLEGLTPFNTPGKLRNLRLGPAEIQEAIAERPILARVRALVRAVEQLQPLAAYLAEAQANLPAEHPWSQEAAATREIILDDVRRLGAGQPGHQPEAALRGALENLKAGYIRAYSEQHRALVLGPSGDDRRQRLYRDARLAALGQLSPISLLNANELGNWKRAVAALPTCRGFHDGAIAETPTCPACHLRPAQYHAAAPAEQELQRLDSQLDDLLRHWRQSLRANLQSETAQQSLRAMAEAERQPIEAFLAQPDDSTLVPAGFAAAAEQALRGIEALALSEEALLAALKAGGLPCTLEELQQRFAGFLAQAMRGHDRRNTRLTLS